MKMWALRAALLVVILGTWELASGRLISMFFLSRPSLIAAKFWKILIDGTLLNHMAITTSEAVAGFVIGGSAGALIGLALGRSKLLAETLDPFIVAFYSLPKVALAPMFILWFGVGYQMRVMFTAIIVLFLVFLSTYTGVRNVSRELVTVFRLMGANERHLLRMVIVPSAFSWIFAGLRLSVPYALIGAIVAEILAGNAGLGYLVEHAAAQFDTAGVFAALAGVMLLALTLNYAVRLLERWVMPWRDVEEQREIAV
jgi:NitT/TauT family transport system permease protein